VEFGVGDAQSSLHAMTESARNFELLAQARDATPGQLMEAASTLGSLGDVYGMPEAASLDDIHKAIECYEQQIALSQRALQIDPANVRARRSVAIGEYKNATLIVDQKPVEAIGGYSQALGELNGLPQQALSAAPTLRLLYLIEAHLGRAYASQGKRAEAVAATLHARDEAAVIVARDPLDDRARFDLATTDKTLGDHMVSANDREGAMQAYRQALDTFDFILRRDPGKAVVQQHRQEVEEILKRGAISSKAHASVSR
jgi:tetratricopeptide (TPR) repeat protein